MSRLTIPSAGTNPGRAPRAVEVVPSEAGAAMSGFGDVMREVGQRLETDRLDRQMKRAQVDLTRDVNDLRLEIEQIGDPDAAEEAWTQGVGSLRDRYTQPGDDGSARIDRRNQDDFGLVFDSLTNSVAFDIGRRNLGLRNAEREATWLDYSQTVVDAAARANPEMRAIMLSHGFEMIDDDLAAGRIDAAEAERRRQNLPESVDNARALRMVSDDPQGFITAAQAGQFDGLGGETIARYEVQAANAIEAEERRQATEAERIQRERQAEVGDRLASLREIMADGREAVDEGFLASPEAQAHPEYARTMAARSLRSEGRMLAEMSPRQIDALIAGEKTRKLEEPWEAERLNVLTEWRDRHEAGYRQDPVGHRQSLGLPVIDLPEFDPADPTAFLKALEFRRRDAQEMVAEGYSEDLRLLSDEERAEINKLAGVETDPATRVALARTLTRAAPDTADRVTGIIADPVFAHVSGYIGAGGTEGTAQDILRGQRILAEKTVILPPERERKSEAFNHLKGYFADLPAAADEEASVIAAADALYASRMRQTGPTDDIDDGVYRQSVHEVLGGTGAYDAAGAKGGLQDYNGKPTPLPRGVGTRDVKGVVSLLTKDLSGRRSLVDPQGVKADMKAGRPFTPVYLTEDEARQRGQARLQAASQSGGLPTFEGALIHPDDLAAADLRAIGPDLYRLWLDGEFAVDHATGEPFEFSLTTLLREASQ